MVNTTAVLRTTKYYHLDAFCIFFFRPIMDRMEVKSHICNNQNFQGSHYVPGEFKVDIYLQFSVKQTLIHIHPLDLMVGISTLPILHHFSV